MPKRHQSHAHLARVPMLPAEMWARRQPMVVTGGGVRFWPGLLHLPAVRAFHDGPAAWRRLPEVLLGAQALQPREEVRLQAEIELVEQQRRHRVHRPTLGSATGHNPPVRSSERVPEPAHQNCKRLDRGCADTASGVAPSRGRASSVDTVGRPTVIVPSPRTGVAQRSCRVPS